MRHRHLPFLLALVLPSLPVHQARADAIFSPDTAHTFAFASIIDHELRWIPSQHLLAASVTFSNENYISRAEMRRDERYDFFLPGLRFDSRRGLFCTPAGIPAAFIRPGVFGAGVHLMPGARIEITSRSGAIHLALTATRQPRPGLRWVEHETQTYLPGTFR